MRNLNIAVAGAGIGGLAAGAALAEAGNHVRIYDQFDRPEPVGSGLIIQPVGQAVLELLDVIDTALTNGRRITGMRGWDVRFRKPALNVDYDPAHLTGNFGLGIHRSTIFEILLNKAVSSGAEVVTGHKVTGITNYQNRSLLFENGDKSESFDLVIDACGVHSPLSPLKARKLPFGALWGTVDWIEGTAFSHAQLTQKYSRADKMAGVLPIGKLPGSDKEKAAVFWSLNAGEFKTWQETPFQDWLNEVTELWPESEVFFSQLTQHGQVTPAFYSHGTLGNWRAPGLFHIGDAAHQTSPQLGQGANMALLDAWALTVALDNCNSLPKALKAAQGLRMRHLRIYQIVSRWFTPLYQSENRTAPFIRDRLLAPLSGIGPVRSLLAKTAGGELVSPMRDKVLRNL